MYHVNVGFGYKIVTSDGAVLRDICTVRPGCSGHLIIVKEATVGSHDKIDLDVRVDVSDGSGSRNTIELTVVVFARLFVLIVHISSFPPVPAQFAQVGNERNPSKVFRRIERTVTDSPGFAFDP